MIPLSLVTGSIAKLRERVETIRGRGDFRPDAPTKMQRERWEITVAKIMVLDDLAKELANDVGAASESGDLMAEKPALPQLVEHLEAQRKRHRSFARSYSERSLDPGEPRIPFCREEFARHDAIASFAASLIEFVKTISGNAEEQPESRENDPPPVDSLETVTAGGDQPSFPFLNDRVGAVGEGSMPWA